ncbi:MAG: hypothetical protein ACLP8S_25570 [Solirubrobacteraceae bacterium]
MSDERPFDPPAIFAALERHAVDHVTIGGLAVGLWGYPRATKDTDIVVPDPDAENDRRLELALQDLSAAPLELQTAGADALGIRWEPDGDVQRWQTTGGTLDVLRNPEGSPPYPQLRERAEPTEIEGTRTQIAAIDHLIAMKLAAGRNQDLVDLETLLDPRNTESRRVRLRALDRQRLRVQGEPRELGEPVDPCEREIDALRRTLLASGAGDELERRLARRGRELQALSTERVAELAQIAVADPPASLQAPAAAAADLARELDVAEDREFGLFREHKRVALWRRGERDRTERQLAQATGEAERLRAQGEAGVDALRATKVEIERWWGEHQAATVEAIAARRERYRREREQLAARVSQAPQQPASYVLALIGERPADPVRERWDHAARAIEAYAAQYSDDGPLRSPSAPDRAQRGAWERMSRVLGELEVDPTGPRDPSRGSSGVQGDLGATARASLPPLA